MKIDWRCGEINKFLAWYNGMDLDVYQKLMEFVWSVRMRNEFTNTLYSLL